MSSGKTSSRKGRATPKRRRRRPLKTKTPDGAIVLSEDSQEHSGSVLAVCMSVCTSVCLSVFSRSVLLFVCVLMVIVQV